MRNLRNRGSVVAASESGSWSSGWTWSPQTPPFCTPVTHKQTLLWPLSLPLGLTCLPPQATARLTTISLGKQSLSCSEPRNIHGFWPTLCSATAPRPPTGLSQLLLAEVAFLPAAFLLLLRRNHIGKERPPSFMLMWTIAQLPPTHFCVTVRTPAPCRLQCRENNDMCDVLAQYLKHGIAQENVGFPLLSPVWLSVFKAGVSLPSSVHTDKPPSTSFM